MATRNYPDFRKAPEGATHWDTELNCWANSKGYWASGDFWSYETQKGWGTSRYIPCPVVDWSKAPKGCDYAYTTGPEWGNSPVYVSEVEFADEKGSQADGWHSLELGEDGWVLLETRPESCLDGRDNTLVKDYKILEVFVDDLSMPFRYRGYWGSLHINLSDNLIHGRISLIRDNKVTYEASTVEGIKQAFIDAVDDYILSREEIDK